MKRIFDKETFRNSRIVSFFEHGFIYEIKFNGICCAVWIVYAQKAIGHRELFFCPVRH